MKFEKKQRTYEYINCASEVEPGQEVSLKGEVDLSEAIEAKVLTGVKNDTL